MRSIQKKAAGMTKGGFLSCTEKETKRNRIDIPFSVYVFFIISLFLCFDIVISLSLNQIEKEWILSPISNTKSYLLIERSSSNTGLCLFFFLGIPHIQSGLPQAPHLIRLVGGAGCSPFESNKVKSQ